MIARRAHWRAMTAPPRRQPSPAGTSRRAPVAVARTVAGRLGAWAVVVGMVVYTGTLIVRCVE